jgi:hypothetical protein
MQSFQPIILASLLLCYSAQGQEAPSAISEDIQTIPQALSLFSEDRLQECEALLSPEVRTEDWTLPVGYLFRAKNLITLGLYAKEQHNATVAQSIATKVAQYLDTAAPAIPSDDIPNKVLQLKLRATLEGTLLGNSEQADQLLEQAAALEPPPPEEPASPAEE